MISQQGTGVHVIWTKTVSKLKHVLGSSIGAGYTCRHEVILIMLSIGQIDNLLY